VFVKGKAAKYKLRLALSEANLNKTLDAAFFPDGRWRSNFLCNLVYCDPASVRPRNPQLSFDEACRIE